MAEFTADKAARADVAAPSGAPDKCGMAVVRLRVCGGDDDSKSALLARLISSHGERAAARGPLAGAQKKEDAQQEELWQGIDPLAALQCFVTAKRKFLVLDATGRQQEGCAMGSPASRSDLALVMIDARQGMSARNRRESCIAHLLGVRHAIVAVDAGDAVDVDEARFAEVEAAYREFAAGIGIAGFTAIPISTTAGDNISLRSARMPWYSGPTLIEGLESAPIPSALSNGPLRLPVHEIRTLDNARRGYVGTIVMGSVRPGDPIVALPSGSPSTVARIVSADGDLTEAGTGTSVLLEMTDEIDVSQGDVICAANDRAGVADQFSVDLLWMNQKPMLRGRTYLLQLGRQTAECQIGELKYVLGADAQARTVSRRLMLNDIGRCNISLSRPIVFDPCAKSHDMGGFLLLDREASEPVGEGMIRFALRRAHNIHWQASDIEKQARADQKNQRACCLWFTGLSGSGKTTIANHLDKRLYALGYHSYILDGDNLRHGLNRDLGFTEADRVENIRRAAEVARLMVDAGLITIVSFISPFRAERQFARERFETDEFVEVFIDTPLEVCEARDPKGLYRKVRAGLVQNFTGISSPYEPPSNADCHIQSELAPPEAHANRILQELLRRGIISAP